MMMFLIWIKRIFVGFFSIIFFIGLIGLIIEDPSKLIDLMKAFGYFVLFVIALTFISFVFNSIVMYYRKAPSYLSIIRRYIRRYKTKLEEDRKLAKVERLNKLLENGIIERDIYESRIKEIKSK